MVRILCVTGRYSSSITDWDLYISTYLKPLPSMMIPAYHYKQIFLSFGNTSRGGFLRKKIKVADSLLVSYMVHGHREKSFLAHYDDRRRLALLLCVHGALIG